MKSAASLLCLVIFPAWALDPRVEFALGVLEKSRGNELAAAEHFENARLGDPLALPLVKLAVARSLAAGDRAGAVKLYRELAAARPDEVGVQLAYADFLDEQSRGDSLARKLSDETLEAALGKYPGHPEVIRRLFRHAQADDNGLRQTELMEMLSMDDPVSVLLFNSLSRSMHDASDAEARSRVDERFLLAFETERKDEAVARAASEHFRETGRLEKAIGILRLHVDAAPSSLALRTRLGVLYFTAKMDPEGEATLKEVLEINPRQALAHQSLAKFYRLREQVGPARFHAGELLKIRGGPPADFIRLADEWLATDDPREARLLLEKSVFDRPDHRELAEKLAIATRRDPETRDQAARFFRQAEAMEAEDETSNPDFLLEFAEALIAEGQGNAAEDRLRSAIRTYPADAKKETASALRRLAALWESEGKNAAAARSLRQRADGLDH